MESSFIGFLTHLLEVTFNTANPNGLLALFLLAVITDIGIPVPFILDTILILAAYRASLSVSHEWTPVISIVVMLFLGRQVGSGILYFLSRSIGKKFLNWLNRHIPSIGRGLDSFKMRLNHWAPLVIVTGRLTPGLLQVTSVASGACRLRYLDFALGIAFASIIYDGILIFLGFIAAHGPKSGDVNFTDWVVIAMVIIVCILWPIVFVLARRSKKTAQ
jgi:membrane protein DedA with SNARE-associated domain